MRSLVRATCVAIVVVMAPAVQAATVQDIQGAVLVNQGGGFQRIGGPSPVATGARVMAQTNSSAFIVYDNGCREKVEAGAVVTVKPEGVCEVTGSGATPYLVGGAIIAGAGAAVAIGLSDDKKKPASP